MLLEIGKNKREALNLLWITRINSASRSLGVTYSELINGFLKKDIKLNRKILSDLATNDAPVFQKIVKTAVK